MQAELSNAPKFGNDMDLPDQYANQVATIFHDALTPSMNTRGGIMCRGIILLRAMWGSATGPKHCPPVEIGENRLPLLWVAPTAETVGG